jgi:hypothetical protein
MGGVSTFLTSSKAYDWSDEEKVTKRSARSYAADDGRVYKGYSSKGLKPPVGMNIYSESEIPLVLMLDLTGSMCRLPEFILERIPTMYHETNAAIQGYDPKEAKLVEVPLKLEMSIIGVGDAYSDKYPLQVLDFKKYNELTQAINKIYPEGGGGGSLEESYELAAYYLLNHCKTPNSKIKPICIIVGDEAFYERVNEVQVEEFIGDKLDQDLDSYEVMKQLKEKFDTYVLRPEPSYSKEEYEKIHKKWTSVFSERVSRMKDPEAIVNCMIMIGGIASNHYQEALHMLERREEKWEIDQALEAVHPFLASQRKESELKK